MTDLSFLIELEKQLHKFEVRSNVAGFRKSASSNTNPKRLDSKSSNKWYVSGRQL